MFYWIYDIPALLVIGLFAAFFVAVCWLGTYLLRPYLSGVSTSETDFAD